VKEIQVEVPILTQAEMDGFLNVAEVGDLQERKKQVLAKASEVAQAIDDRIATLTRIEHKP